MPPVTPPAAKFADLARTLTSASDAELHDIAATRRSLILAPLLAALPAALLTDPAHAVDPTQTQITQPDQMQWKPWSAGGAAGAMESAAVFGAIDKPGPYMHDIAATRRGLILAPFLVALPAALLSDLAYAVDPRQTQVTLPGEMQWKPWSAGGAEGAMESAAVFGAIDKPGRTRSWCAGTPAT